MRFFLLYAYYKHTLIKTSFTLKFCFKLLYSCVMHCVLKYLDGSYMTNTTLRERFGLDAKDVQMTSNLIRQTIELGLIKEASPTQSRKNRQYIPTWFSLEE